jgi:sugar porter (SP) family MFS transporter
MAVQTVNTKRSEPDSQPRLDRAVFWSSAITALGGLLFGYDTGVVSGALLFLHNSFGSLSSLQKELVTSLLLVGAAVGAAGTGRLADRFGRRPLILATAAVFVVGVLGAAFAPTYAVLVAMRFVIGLAVGSASMSVPLYIGELAPARYRGAMVSLNQLAITSGILFSFLIDYWLSSSQNWRLMFGLAAVPAAMLFIGTLLQPESPHWLISKNRVDEAREVLARYRHGDEDVDREIEDVQSVAGRDSRWSDLVEPKVRKLLVIGVSLAVFQQVTGINTVIYYAPTLLKNAGFGNSAALLANVGNGAVNVGMTIVAILIIDRVGRRPLLIFGTAGMAVALTTIGIDFAVGWRQSSRRWRCRRDRCARRLYRIIRDRPWPGVLVADQRALSAAAARDRNERGNRRELGGELRRDHLILDTAQCDHECRDVLLVRRDHGRGARLLRSAGPRDQRSDLAGDRARPGLTVSVAPGHVSDDQRNVGVDGVAGGNPAFG